MLQKLALKRLSASDLTFFEWHFIHRNAGNQKAINLNADVFIGQLYPNLPGIAEGQGDRLPVDLYLYGPGLAGEYNLQRKIVKGETYKNWRLNGEFVHNPPDDSDRFNVLIAEDIAVFSFRGELFPHAASIFFIAANQPEDSDLHHEFMKLIGSGRRSMIDISQRQLAEIIQRVDTPDIHPLYDLLLDDALEDAAQNGIVGIRRLRSKASRRRISHETLRQARENGGRIGRRGEEFVYYYLANQKLNRQIIDFRWIADENAISPYDFEVATENGLVLVDVKSTETGFNNSIHISYNELLQMREATSYDLYRLYEVGDTYAQLRIARGLKDFAETVLATLEQLPNGVRSDSISVTPDILNFESPLSLEISTDAE